MKILLLTLIGFLVVLLLVFCIEKIFNYIFNKIYPSMTGKDKYDKKIKEIICKPMNLDMLNEIKKIMKERDMDKKKKLRVEKLKKLKII